MSIKDNLQKIKSNNTFIKTLSIFRSKTLIFGTIAIFLAIFSFGLGRLSSLRDARVPIVLGTYEFKQEINLQKNSNISLPTASLKSEEIVVASKNGTVYHLPDCAGAKRISPENKITFKSRAEAEKAGLKPAQNCKGL